MSKQVNELYEFGPFRVDPQEHLLLRDGKPVAVTPKAFDTLLVLLQNSGHLLLKDELLKAVWPDSFVEEVNLSQNISALRRALGDTAQESRYIATVPGKGYRFIGEVRAIQPAEEPQDTPIVEERPQLQAPIKQSRPMRFPALIAGTVALAAVVVVVLGAYKVRWAGEGKAAVSAKPQISSIAVLPLENLSNDPQQEYFVEGMTDEIITDLAQLPGLRVISRTSTQQYKGTHKSLPQIARELNVNAVLEGTVLRAGNRVRIRAQLIYAPSDQHLWAEAYERDAKDVLTLQATLARDIAGEIRLNLTSQEQAHLSAPRTVDPEAHEFYLKGRYFWNKRDKEGLDKAVEYFQQAIAKDPNYAAAYAGLADAYSFGGGRLASQAEAMAEAKSAANKALELDSNLADAEASLGLIALFTDWNWGVARQHFERAIALDPNYATAHHWYAEGYLMSMGQVDSAIGEVRRAQELDPLSPVIATDLGKELYFAHKYDEAIVEFRRALELDPNFISAHNWLSDTFLEKGLYPEASAELEKTKSFKEERVYLRQRAYLHARMGKRSEAEKDLAKSLQLSRGKQVSSGAVALVYAMLGRKDESIQWLETAYSEKSSFMMTLKLWPAFDAMRGDPRFSDLLRKVGLPE